MSKLTGYNIIHLEDMIGAINEEKVKEILSSFSSPKNKDVELFIREKATEFSKQGLSKTSLVYTSCKNTPVLIGYFTLANKNIMIKRDSIKSNTLKKRINKFSQKYTDIKDYIITAPLIGQLGKNFSNGYNALITGDELLKMALDQISSAQKILGGKFVYVECQNEPKLIEFYESNGFVSFAKRKLDKDEINVMKDTELIQLIKYMK